MADNTLTSDQQGLYDKLVAQLRTWGLVTDDDQSMAELIWRLTKQDKSGDFMLSEIRASTAYQKRFPALAEINKKYNLGWSEADYISQEQSYIEALNTLGPAGARYKTRDQFAEWMRGDVAPVEVQRRIDDASTYIYLDAPSSVRDALRGMYGLSDEDMVAYMLDPDKVGKELELQFAQRTRKANIMGAAADAGLGALSNNALSEISESRYASTYGDAAMQFSNIAAEADSWNKLAEVNGESKLSADELAVEAFGTASGSETSKKKKRLASSERARFNGSSGLGGRSLATGGLGQQ